MDYHCVWSIGGAISGDRKEAGKEVSILASTREKNYDDFPVFSFLQDHKIIDKIDNTSHSSSALDSFYLHRPSNQLLS